MTPVIEIPSSSPMPSVDLAAINQSLDRTSAGGVLSWAHSTFGNDLVLATGFGPSGVVLIHELAGAALDIPVFYIDTDLLFPSTYAVRETLAQRYGVTFTRLHSGLSVEQQAERYGDQLWNRDPDKCCNIRKVTPLRHYLRDKSAWITGLRRDQSPARADTQIVEWDARSGLYKVNPLAGWTSDEIWSYIRDNDLPYNELHDQGYPSIGCGPCTKRAGDRDGERAGRWPGLAKTECGIHQKQEAA